MDEDIVQTLTLSNRLLARNPDEKRAIPFEISFTRTLEPIVLLHKASTSLVSGSENRFIRFTEPIRLLHRTHISSTCIPRTDLFGSRNRSVCYTECKFLEFVFQEPTDWFHGTDWFTTQNAQFSNLFLRNQFDWFHGTDCLKRQFHILNEFWLSPRAPFIILTKARGDQESGQPRPWAPMSS